MFIKTYRVISCLHRIYDGFSIDSSLETRYADLIAALEKRFYRSALRFTRSPFQRLRFGAELAKRDLSARITSQSVRTGGT